MPEAEVVDKLREMKRSILQLFPVGSYWYDCLQDHGGIVVAHFEPRGLVLQPDAPLDREYWRYGYAQLLSGELREPREGGRFHEYRREVAAIDLEFKRFCEERGIGGMWQNAG